MPLCPRCQQPVTQSAMACPSCGSNIPAAGLGTDLGAVGASLIAAAILLLSLVGGVTASLFWLASEFRRHLGGR